MAVGNKSVNVLIITCGHWSEKSAEPRPKRQSRRNVSSRNTRCRPWGKEDTEEEEEEEDILNDITDGIRNEELHRQEGDIQSERNIFRVQKIS